MGLGKTLTTLALIGSSLGRAAQYVAGSDSLEIPQGRGPLRARATLVVAPSLRKSEVRNFVWNIC